MLPATQMGTSSGPGCSNFIRCPANGMKKATEDASSTWAPVPKRKTQRRLLATVLAVRPHPGSKEMTVLRLPLSVNSFKQTNLLRTHTHTEAGTLKGVSSFSLSHRTHTAAPGVSTTHTRQGCLLSPAPPSTDTCSCPGWHRCLPGVRVPA